MSWRQLRLSQEAIEQGLALGLDEAELTRMMRLAAPLTHPQGNRRYQDYWLRIDNNLVTAVGRLELVKRVRARPARGREV